MKWKEIVLDRKGTVDFLNGERIEVEYLQRGPRSSTPQTGGKRGWASLVGSAARTALELVGAVDDGETVDKPHLFVLYGGFLHKLMLLGGYFGYVIDSELRLHSKVPLKRIPETEEYWATVLLCTDYGVVVVYENGVMLIAEDLSVKWHVAKFSRPRCGPALASGFAYYR